MPHKFGDVSVADLLKQDRAIDINNRTPEAVEQRIVKRLESAGLR